ncbi:MAG: DUF1353 domain-containing protein [Pseudomonadota bacterium]
MNKKVILTPSHPKIVNDRDNYRKFYLTQDVIVDLPKGHRLIVKMGYRFDGHSVPWPLKFFLLKAKGKDIYAALVHDYLIETEGFHRFNRRFIDRVYMTIMEDDLYFTSKFRRYWMPLAVNINGFFRWTFWGDYRGKPKTATVVDVQIR